jgi:hypothetical protein
MKVGFIDLNESAFKVEKQIDNLLRDRWLDHETAHEFHEQKFKRRKQKGGLKALLKEIEAEIQFRKKAFGGTSVHQNQGVNNESTRER